MTRRRGRRASCWPSSPRNSSLCCIIRTRVVHTLQSVASHAHDLDLFASLLRVLEQRQFTSARLRALSEALVRAHQPASTAIGRLDQLVALLSVRANIITGLPAALMFWGTQMALAIDSVAPPPRHRHSRAGSTSIGEFDALLALAGFAAEHPAFTFPDLVDGHPQIAADEPRAPAARRLGGQQRRLAWASRRRDCSSSADRTCPARARSCERSGLNVVLAQTGAPVRATRLVLSPLAVGASIRVLDSLLDGKSRFYAEITRLKQVVDLVVAENGHTLFLLDEILSGTNSHDRRHRRAGAPGGTRRPPRGRPGDDARPGARRDRRRSRVTRRQRPLRGPLPRRDDDLRLPPPPGVVQTSNAVELMRSVGLHV